MLPDTATAGEPYPCPSCGTWIIAGALRRAGRTTSAWFEVCDDGADRFLALPMPHADAHIGVPFVRSGFGRHRPYGESRPDKPHSALRLIE